MKTNDRRKPPLGQGGVGDSVGLVAFDADDTLWDCQGAFCAVEHALAELLSPYAEADEVLRVLAATERRNMPLTGYGAKAFTLSMVAAAGGVGRGCVGGEGVGEVLRLGRRLMELPATPLPGVEATLRRVREVVLDRDDLDLFEVSLVTFPANEQARVSGVKTPAAPKANDATRAIVARSLRTDR